MEAPTIYNFHPETKQFIGSSLGEPSPLDPPGVWLFPANSTEIAPPPSEPETAFIWDDANEQWLPVLDLRGQTWWAGPNVEITIDFLGDPAAQGLLPNNPYVPPPTPSPFLPLKPYQFWGAVRALGYEQDLKDWVATIVDPVERGIASAMLEYSLEFRRDHQLMAAARLALGMTESELDSLWLWGLTL